MILIMKLLCILWLKSSYAIILKYLELRYKSTGGVKDTPSIGETPAKQNLSKAVPVVPVVSSTSHLDAVPQATPINR